MKVLVIDDEELARRRILNLLEEVPQMEVLGECSNGKMAIKQINDLKPNLIFLDINMKDMNGFEVLQNITISPKPVVIFVTAHDNYASRAFDVDAFDFLLKPFKDERFYRTINKVLNLTTPETEQNFEKRIRELFRLYSEEAKIATAPLKIPVKQGNKTVLIDASHIYYIIASGYYAEIYTENKKFVLRESLNNLSDLLDPVKFCRIHRSTIININHIKELVHSEFSELDVRMCDDKLLHISKSNKKQFLEKIGI